MTTLQPSNIDLITLECLVNPDVYEKFINKTIGPPDRTLVSKTERKFYRKRILNATKQMLKNDFNGINEHVKEGFIHYMMTLITYFKYLDTHEILQNDYKDMNASNLQINEHNDNIDDDFGLDDDDNVNEDISINKTNEMLYNAPQHNKKITLDNFVITKKQKTNQAKFYPHKKEVDLTNPELKNKGLKNEKNDKKNKKDKNDKKENTIN
jgi:hypothetical protein